MNARIEKETRALMPVLLVTIGLVVAASLLFHPSAVLGASAAALGVCATLIGASSFGNEFSTRTFALLLAQPVSRRQIWNEKLLVLGAALGIAWAVWLACVFVFAEPASFNSESIQIIATVTVILVGIFCSTPWMAMRAGNTYFGAIAAWIFPYFILLLVMLAAWWLSLDRYFQDGDLYPLVLAGAAAYFAFAYWRGWRTFRELQAVEVRHRDVALPQKLESALARPLATILPRYSGPISCLVRKELGLQKPCYILTAVTCAMAAVEAVVQKLHPSETVTGFLAVNIIICVGIAPMVSTGLSVAEERNLGVAGWHSLLPPSALKQWLVKLTVVIGTCVLLGVVLPIALGIVGQALQIVPGSENAAAPKSLWSILDIFSRFGCVVYLSLLALGIFASSLSTTTFRALLLFFGFAAGGALVIGLSYDFAEWLAVNLFYGAPKVKDIWISGEMLVTRELVVAVGLIGYLAYRNYRRGETRPPVIWLQSTILFATLALGSIIVGFARFW